MTDVRDFILFSGVSNVVDLSWCIKFTKFEKTEVEPIFLIIVDVEVVVCSAVDVSSVIA